MDSRELKDRASAFFVKGKFAKAAETYEAYCKLEPKDMQTHLRRGDAWSKSGNKAKAMLAYQHAAEGFAKDGFLPRAIAASKLVLELDPSHTGVQKMLADLYARKSGGSRPPAGPTAPAPEGKGAPPTKPAAAVDKHAPIEIAEEAPAAAVLAPTALVREVEVAAPVPSVRPASPPGKADKYAPIELADEGPAPTTPASAADGKGLAYELDLEPPPPGPVARALPPEARSCAPSPHAGLRPFSADRD